MAMEVQKQPEIAKKDYRIITARYNATVLGDFCTRLKLVQQNDGEVNGTSRIKSMRISESIQSEEMEIQQLLMTINLLLQYSGLVNDTRSMMSSIGGQEEMIITPNGKDRIHDDNNIHMDEHQLIQDHK
jgi:hypothetical protein